MADSAVHWETEDCRVRSVAVLTPPCARATMRATSPTPGKGPMIAARAERRVPARLALALTFVLALAATGRAQDASSGPTASADSLQALRGTEAPLARRVSPLRYAARGMLLVPYAGVRVATWPLVKLAEAEDRAQALSRLASLLRLGYERGPFQSTLRFGYESGLGFSLVGLDVTARDWPEPGAHLLLSGGYLARDENLATFRFRSAPRLLQWELLGLVEHKRERPFYGIGVRSEDRVTTADRRRVLGEATLALRPTEVWAASVTGYVRRDDLRDPHDDDDDESASDRFPDLFALAATSDYAGAEAALQLDTRDREAFAMRGTLVRVLGGTDRASSGGDADYRHWSGELQTHVNLWRHTRVLALRGLIEGVESDDPSAVPYTELVRLGGKTGARGYARNRFTDTHGLLLTGEYRYPVTTHMQGGAFVDWGTVASRTEALRLADLDPSIGLRLAYVLGDNALVAHVAHGPEGFEFYVGTDTVFESRSRRMN